MTDQEQHWQRVDYFNARYLKIDHYWFESDDHTPLRDHIDDADRKCRFCGQGSPQVGFRELAHARPGVPREPLDRLAERVQRM